MNIHVEGTEAAAAAPAPEARPLDPQWFKDAVIYQLHVKSFFDSTNDGVGDFPGLISKLDYLAELGVNTVWLLPFYPSPRRDDGYDIADYTNVHPEYGTIDDARRFFKAAHERGIRVIIELVLNHTSDQHPWFQRARRAPPGSPEREFYVWSDSDKRYSGTRIIFLDTEKSNWTWDEEAKAYYWHRFYAHQPDLNFDNPAVFEEMLKVMRFWLDLGVDGLRLDAVPYLVEREGTNNENLPETHAILKHVRAEVDAHYAGRMLLAEANQWPEDVQQYFGNGDECHMLFHFPLMPRMYMAIAQEDRFPVTDIMRQTPEAPPGCQWATFLRNHDELTLEMVTDRERDYLWKTYAADRRARLNLGIRRRLAPLLERDRRRIELMNSLLLTLMGTPILYYGDEIGMGDNIHLGDRDGVRTPMQWTPDRNGGFSRADPAALVLPPIMDPLYGYEAVNVEAQSRDPYSLLNWVRRMLSVRGRWRAFGRGGLRFLRPQNRKVLAYLREFEGETVLCVANVSRTAQAVELELGEFSGRTPVELSGEVPFPKIGQLTYLLTLPPFGFYWFCLSAETQQPTWSTATSDTPADYHTFVLRGSLAEITSEPQRSVLEREVLPTYIAQRRWYQAKSTGVPQVRLAAMQPIVPGDSELLLTILDVELQGKAARYAQPLSIAWEDVPPAPFEGTLALARVRRGRRIGLLTDGFASPIFAREVLARLAEPHTAPADGKGLIFNPTPASPEIPADASIEWPGVEQSNSTVVVGRAAVIKLFRRLVEGVHPEVEMVRELTDRGFTGIASLLGDVAYVGSDGGGATIAVVQRFVDNQGDAFRWSVDAATRLIDDYAVATAAQQPDIAGYRNFIKTVGRRVGQMHQVLAQPSDNPDFAPETVDDARIALWRERMRGQLEAAFDAIDRSVTKEGPNAEALHAVVQRRDAVIAAASAGLAGAHDLPITRIHGDLHLGQLLVAGNDVVIIDFEGEPLKPLAERRAKYSPLRDVAGMLRSFDYVGGVVMKSDPFAKGGPAAERAMNLLNTFGKMARRAFLTGYASGRGRRFELRERRLLGLFALEKAAYEIVYEAENRPDWIDLPLAGFVKLGQRVAGIAP